MKFSEIKPGAYFTEDDKVYRVLQTSHSHMGRGGATVQMKIRELQTGKTLTRSLKPSDSLEDVDVEKGNIDFIFQKKGEYWFKRDTERLMLPGDVIGDKAKFLKPNLRVIGIFVDDALVNIELPIKVEYAVKEAPPTMKGNTVQGSYKTVTLETGASIQAPFFIEAGDTILVNTDEERYIARAQEEK